MSRPDRRRSRGFSLLEVMLAAIVLMIGVMAVSKLGRGMLSGFDSTQPQGLNQHPAIVENLLRDQVEQVRSAAYVQVPALLTPHGTYSASVTTVGAADVGARPAVQRQRYVATVRFQAVGAAAPGVVAGQVTFDQVPSVAGRTGL